MSLSSLTGAALAFKGGGGDLAIRLRAVPKAGHRSRPARACDIEGVLGPRGLPRVEMGS